VSGDLTKISKAAPDENGLLKQGDFTTAIQYNGYIMMEASDTPEKSRRVINDMHPETGKKPTKTILVLLDQYSNHTDSAQDFNKLLNKLPNIGSSHLEHNMDVIIIPYENPSSNIVNKLLEHTSNGSEDSGYVRFMLYSYAFFTSNKMKSSSIAPSRILSKKEEKEVDGGILARRSAYSKIRVIDVVAVWLGAEIGDIIEEDIPSESSGIGRNYRLVRA